MSWLWREREGCQSTSTTNHIGFYVTSVIHDTSSIPHRIFFSAIQCVGPLGDLAKDETVQSIGLKIEIHKLLNGRGSRRFKNINTSNNACSFSLQEIPNAKEYG